MPKKRKSTGGLPPIIRASVVVVSHNSGRHLETCLDSLLHTVGLDCEVIVVDNASTDGSDRFVAERFPWVKLIRNASNEGFARANNKGVSAASGQYVVALNPDTEVTAGWLDALLGPLEARPESGRAPVGITTARILMMDKRNRVNTCGNLMHYTGITVCRGLNRPADAPELAEPGDVLAVSGACFAIKRELWDKLGGLDESYFTYLEDTDLSMRARLAGYRCVYVPQAVVYHQYTGSFSARKFFYLERNRLFMLLKCYRKRTLFLMLPALALAEVVAWGYALKRGRGHLRAKMRAYQWLLLHREQIRRKRVETQLSRRISDAEMLDGMAWQLNIEQLAGPIVGRLAERVLNPAFKRWYGLVRQEVT